MVGLLSERWSIVVVDVLALLDGKRLIILLILHGDLVVPLESCILCEAEHRIELLNVAGEREHVNA